MNEPTNGYAALAGAILAEIAFWENRPGENTPIHVADRERVASDLAGLRDHHRGSGILTDECGRCYQMSDPCDDAARYAEGLRRTAALYGVTASAEAHAHG